MYIHVHVHVYSRTGDFRGHEIFTIFAVGSIRKNKTCEI